MPFDKSTSIFGQKLPIHLYGLQSQAILYFTESDPASWIWQLLGISHCKNTADFNPLHNTGTKGFYLADYRSNDALEHYIVDRWTTVDLSAFGADTNQLQFELTSSDNVSYDGGMTYYMNTPAYVAADNLVLTPVPEPGSIFAIAAGAGILLRWRKRKMK